MYLQSSDIFVLLTLCICLSQVQSYPVETLQGPQPDLPLETDYDLLARNMVKKDIFMSRGWGAAGMPYSMYYLDKPLPGYQQRHKNRQNPTKPGTNSALYAKQEEEVLENGNGLDAVNNFEALRSPSVEDTSNVKNVRNDKLRKLSSPPKNKYTIPQLFISYGWGPMG